MPDEPEALFPLIGSMDRSLIEKISKAVRNSFKREDLKAKQLHHMTVLLFGLERMPLATPGVNVTLTVSSRTESEMSYHSIHLDESSLSLSQGGSVYDPRVGGDNFGEDILLVETTGFRDDATMGYFDWLAIFKSRLEYDEIDFEIEDSCEVDWSLEPDASSWERAAIRYESEEGPNED